MPAHAHFSRLVGDPVLLVFVTILVALACPANMACETSLAHHATALHPMLWVLDFALLGRSWSSQMLGGIQLRREAKRTPPQRIPCVTDQSCSIYP